MTLLQWLFCVFAGFSIALVVIIFLGIIVVSMLSNNMDGY